LRLRVNALNSKASSRKSRPATLVRTAQMSYQHDRMAGSSWSVLRWRGLEETLSLPFFYRFFNPLSLKLAHMGVPPTWNLTMPRLKYLVRLTDEERIQLEDLTRTGKRAASVILHARILLKADAGAGGPGWDDDRIAEAVECGASTVYRVRRRSWKRACRRRCSARSRPVGSIASWTAPRRPT